MVEGLEEELADAEDEELTDETGRDDEANTGADLR